MRTIRLYHGSNQDFSKVPLEKSRDRRDFGRGFYTTTIRDQAEQWALSLFDRYGGAGKLLYIIGKAFRVLCPSLVCSFELLLERVPGVHGLLGQRFVLVAPGE